MDSAANVTHPFERAGLGKAPFRFIALRDTAEGANADNGLVKVGELDGVAEVHTKPGGTCAYCGTYIIVMVDVVSSDGHKFHVGTDCAEKTCGKHLVDAVKTAVRKRNRAKTATKSANVQVELGVLFADEEALARLSNLPHPKLPGLTMRDYAEWMVRRSGATGRAKLLKAIKAALA
jgi:hypothetical protein